MVQDLPKTTGSVVLRTDFSSDAAWAAVCAAIREPVGEFRAYVECMSDLAYEGLTVADLVAASARDDAHAGDDAHPNDPLMYVFLVDSVTIAGPESLVLAVDLYEEAGRAFRLPPSQMWSVENNLSIANMFFAEFADAVDADGVYRGFDGE